MNIQVWHSSKLIMLLAIPICGWLWAFAGAAHTSKQWRRIGVGVVISLLAYIIALAVGMITYKYIYLFLMFPCMWLATSMGYGMPGSGDEGSPLGRFWFAILKQKSESQYAFSQATAFKTNLAIRTTVAVMYAAALFPLSLMGTYYLGAFFILCNTVAWAVFIENEGMIGPLLTEELLVGAGIGLGAFLAIL